jgi:hypothetical protein
MTIKALGPDAARNATTYAHPFGNLFTSDRSEYTVAGLAQNEIVAVGMIPPNFRVLGLIHSNAAMGANTGIKWGYAPRDGADAGDDDAFATVADSSTAAATFTPVVPFVVEKESFVTAKQTGAGTGAGKLTAHVVGIWLGA